MAATVKHLVDIPALVADLSITLARQSVTGPRNPGRSSDTPMPIDPRALAAGDELSATLSRWCRRVSSSLGRTAPLWGAGSEAMATWLLGHSETIRQADWAPEFVTEVDRVVDRVREAVDLPPERWYAGPCDTCGADLYAYGYSQMVACPEPDCGSVYDVQRRRDWLLASVSDRLATTTEICRALGTLAGHQVTPSSIRGMVNRGQLQSKGPNRQGYPLYRIGDVLDQIISRQQKRKARR